MTGEKNNRPFAEIFRGADWRAATLAGSLLAVFVWMHARGNAVQTDVFGYSAFRWMVGRWGDTVSYGGVDYSHGWLIPFVSAWFVWKDRKRLKASVSGDVDRRGLWAVLAGVLLHTAGFRIAQTRLSMAGLIAMVWGIPFYLYGWQTAKILAFPSAYLVFCIPLTFLDGLTFPLRMVAARLSDIILNGLGIEVWRSGTGLYSAPPNPFQLDVADPCSGLRSLLAIAALCSAYAFATLRSTWKRLTLFLFSIPLAMAGNIVRIVTVAIIIRATGSEAGMRFYHDYSGYLVFASVTVLMVGLGQALARVNRKRENPEKP